MQRSCYLQLQLPIKWLRAVFNSRHYFSVRKRFSSLPISTKAISRFSRFTSARWRDNYHFSTREVKTIYIGKTLPHECFSSARTENPPGLIQKRHRVISMQFRHRFLTKTLKTEDCLPLLQPHGYALSAWTQSCLAQCHYASTY